MRYYEDEMDSARGGRGRDRARGGGDRYSYPEDMDYDYADGADYDYDMRRRRSSTTGRYMRDRHMTKEKRLPEEDLDMWSKSMLSEMEERDKTQMRMDSVVKRAQDMGVTFEKFSAEELYATVLMLHRLFSKSMGPSPMDAYVKMAKSWLCDPDSALRYGKKLAAYYEEIVNDD